MYIETCFLQHMHAVSFSKLHPPNESYLLATQEGSPRLAQGYCSGYVADPSICCPGPLCLSSVVPERPNGVRKPVEEVDQWFVCCFDA